MERNGSCSKHESGMHGLFFPFSCTLFLSQSSFSRIHARITLAVRASPTPFPESDDEVTVVGLFERLLKSERARAEAGITTYERLLKSEHERAEAEHARAEAEHARAEAGSTTYERLLKAEHARAEAGSTTYERLLKSEHARAEAEHAIAEAEHARAEADHARAEGSACKS
jgi:hypothetical protein